MWVDGEWVAQLTDVCDTCGGWHDGQPRDTSRDRQLLLDRLAWLVMHDDYEVDAVDVADAMLETLPRDRRVGWWVAARLKYLMS